MKRILLTTLAGVAMGLHAFGALYDSGFQNGGLIPDGDLNGLADTRTVSGITELISYVSVTLNISGGYNGDLYAYLTHGTGTAILLNRVGVGSAQGDAFGASGSGLSITLAAGYDNIHFTLGGGISGTFAPDGRAIDPLSVPSAFDSAATTADLSTFNNLDANGSWTLFFADTVTGGGNPTLNSWSLDITPVPEPVGVALVVFAAAVAGVQVGRRFWPWRAPRT
jgi:subtilisin-like proprotein convertase family protein